VQGSFDFIKTALFWSELARIGWSEHSNDGDVDRDLALLRFNVVVSRPILITSRKVVSE
jgi:hypothetical protein